MSVRIQVLLMSILGSFFGLPMRAADWSVSFTERASLPPGPAQARAVRYTPGAVKLAIDQDQKRVYRLAPGMASAEVVTMDAARLTNSEETQLLVSLATDSAGRILIPVAWKKPRNLVHFGIVVADGASRRLVELQPPVEVRDLAVDAEGNYYVTGTDTAFFFRRIAQCHVAHKYSPAGIRLASFSPCPNHGAQGETHMRRGGIDFEQLRQDLDLGTIRVDGERVVQTMARRGEVRSFTREGRAVSTTRLRPPSGDHIRLLSYFELKRGGLAMWKTMAGANGKAAASLLVSMHGEDGAARGPERPIAELAAFPVFVDREGRCVFRKRDLRDGREVLLNTEFR